MAKIFDPILSEVMLPMSFISALRGDEHHHEADHAFDRRQRGWRPIPAGLLDSVGRAVIAQAIPYGTRIYFTARSCRT